MPITMSLLLCQKTEWYVWNGIRGTYLFLGLKTTNCMSWDCRCVFRGGKWYSSNHGFVSSEQDCRLELECWIHEDIPRSLNFNLISSLFWWSLSLIFFFFTWLNFFLLWLNFGHTIISFVTLLFSLSYLCESAC